MREFIRCAIVCCALLAGISTADEQCPCEVPRDERGLTGGQQYKVIIQSSVQSISNLNAGFNSALNKWRDYEGTNANAPQLSTTSDSQKTVTVMVDSRDNWIEKGAASQDDGFYWKDPSGNATIVFFTEANPSSWGVSIAERLSSHELGHAHSLDHADGVQGCNQQNTVMWTTQEEGTFATLPTECDKDGATKQYPPPPPCPPPSGCEIWDSDLCQCMDDPVEEGCAWDGDCTCGGSCLNGTCVFAYECTPIIIGVGTSSAYQLTSAVDGVLFDMNGDGIPERVAWTRAGDPVAFLVRDRNHNGIIDDGTELFGNHSVLPSGQPVTNGFEALAYFDRPENGGNGDDLIDNRDNIWGGLMLWIDWNHNGYSEADELYRLDQLGLTSISLAFRTINRQDAFGNVFRLVTSCQFGNKVRMGYDVYFSLRPQRRPAP